jgi:GNAT superfamily N-acetyltransferase
LESLINTDGAIFGAFSGANLVGVLATKKYPRKVEFEFASVVRAHRGKSLASALGSFAIMEFLSQGVTTFVTGGAAVNSSSKATVESLGFTIDELWRSYRAPQ